MKSNQTIISCCLFYLDLKLVENVSMINRVRVLMELSYIYVNHQENDVTKVVNENYVKPNSKWSLLWF